MESRTRTIFRGITYRLMAILATIPITYLITGNIIDGIINSIIINIILLFVYFFNERMWLRIKWDKK